MIYILRNGVRILYYYHLVRFHRVISDIRIRVRLILHIRLDREYHIIRCIYRLGVNEITFNFQNRQIAYGYLTSFGTREGRETMGTPKMERDLYHLAIRLFKDYKFACERGTENYDVDLERECRARIELTQRYWREVMKILTGVDHDSSTPFRPSKEKLIEIGVQRVHYKYRHYR